MHSSSCNQPCGSRKGERTVCFAQIAQPTEKAHLCDDNRQRVAPEHKIDDDKRADLVLQQVRQQESARCLVGLIRRLTPARTAQGRPLSVREWEIPLSLSDRCFWSLVFALLVLDCAAPHGSCAYLQPVFLLESLCHQESSLRCSVVCIGLPKTGSECCHAN